MSMSTAESNNLSQKERFLKSFRVSVISTSEIEVIAIAQSAGFEKIKVGLGEEFKGPVDKHSKVTYRVNAVSEDSVEFAYTSIFDARSFGGEVNRTAGVFSIEQ